MPIIKKQEKEVFKEGNTLRVRSEQDIKTNLVIDNSGLKVRSAITLKEAAGIVKEVV